MDTGTLFQEMGYDLGASPDANLHHFVHLFEGYRATVVEQPPFSPDNPYSPGSARWVSFQQGAALAMKDLGRAAG